MATQKLEERYSNTFRMQNQAKLAARAHREHESRKYPAPDGVRGGHWSSPFMYFGVRDPPFFNPTVPPHNGPLVDPPLFDPTVPPHHDALA